MRSAQLGPEERRQALDRMAAEEFDVVVVGGGVTGAGCALEAASRGSIETMRWGVSPPSVTPRVL